MKMSDRGKGYYLGMTLTKFEDLDAEVDLQPTTKGLVGFIPVFESKQDAYDAGWDKNSIVGVNIGSME